MAFCDYSPEVIAEPDETVLAVMAAQKVLIIQNLRDKLKLHLGQLEACIPSAYSGGLDLAQSEIKQILGVLNDGS